MTIDADFNSEATTYLVGGHSQETIRRQSSSDPWAFTQIIKNEGFLYTFVQGSSNCEIQHQYVVEYMDRGIQAVSITPNYIYGAGL